MGGRGIQTFLEPLGVSTAGQWITFVGNSRGKGRKVGFRAWTGDVESWSETSEGLGDRLGTRVLTNIDNSTLSSSYTIKGGGNRTTGETDLTGRRRVTVCLKVPSQGHRGDVRGFVSLAKEGR